MEADPRTLDHLERLAERNRMRQSRQGLDDARRQERLRDLEQGFDTCWSGANSERVTVD